MRAQEQTGKMLGWWQVMGIERVDLAVKRSAMMKWHYGLALESLPLGWVRMENARQAEVYIRPARGSAWPLVFLDDVAAPLAVRAAGKYDAMVVMTSPAGGCHLWLRCDRSLDEVARRAAQRWLARRLSADLGSVSGEHLGRLAGFKNWKRGGVWVNVLGASCRGRSWDPSPALSMEPAETMAPPASTRAGQGAADTSPSGREWGWICGLLESGCPPDVAYTRLLETACGRRGHDAARYAHRTLQRALQRTGRVL
jgi:hypothetical protein